MKIPLSKPSWVSDDREQEIEILRDDPLYGEGITFVADDGFETTTLLLTPDEALVVGQALIEHAADRTA